MIPYWGRLALRIARVVLAALCAVAYGAEFGAGSSWMLAALAVHGIFATAAWLHVAHDTPARAALATAVDLGYFGLWTWIAPSGWQPVLAAAYLMGSSVLILGAGRMAATGAVAVALAAARSGWAPPLWAVLGLLAAALPAALYRRHLEQRMSTTLRHNVIIRSQALSAREAERQRIAADFHDGPLQNFVSFQMRLEIIRKLLDRNPESAAAELASLQELCRSQVADLRSFVRSMRPPDEGMGLAASLKRMAEALERDAGIRVTFESEQLHDPGEIEVSLEILQIVREALHNIQKHSGATEVSLRARRRGRNVEITVEDNGAGFPFAGAFTLDELEALRIGPVSIRRRVRALGGSLTLESRPAAGATLVFQVPF
jgi:signal transduction histidine kinase